MGGSTQFRLVPPVELVMVVCSEQPVDIAFFRVRGAWRKESTVVRPDPQLKDRLLQFIRNNHTEMYRQWLLILNPLVLRVEC